jgi:hypothetical protein
MHKNATKCNETLSKWCKNKHAASKIMDTFETYQAPASTDRTAGGGSSGTISKRAGGGRSGGPLKLAPPPPLSHSWRCLPRASMQPVARWSSSLFLPFSVSGGALPGLHAKARALTASVSEQDRARGPRRRPRGVGW